MLSLQSQLLLRSADYFEQGRWALFNPTESGIFKEIDNPDLVGFHQYANVFEECQRFADQKQIFGASLHPIPNNDPRYSDCRISHDYLDGLFDGVIIYLPKSKQHLKMLIDNAACIVKPNGLVLVVGENKGGIKSVAKLLGDVGEPVNKLDSAKHCGLYAVEVKEPKLQFSLDDYSLTRKHTINDVTVSLYSLPGVFGHKQVDAGTQLLLNALDDELIVKSKANIYDFACGTGIIGCYIGLVKRKHGLNIINTKKSNETQCDKELVNFSEKGQSLRCPVILSDVFSLALHCAKKSADLNKLIMDIRANDGFVDTDGAFDLIVSNPPFHEGLKNNYQITNQFIKNSYLNSKKFGTLMIVANRFLPYPDIFSDNYGSFQETTKSPKYTVYKAVKR